MQAFLEFVVKGLVDRPDAVKVTPVDRGGITLYELRLHPTDVGKIIGRQGATIQAIRSLLQVGSARKGLRCSIEIVEERPGDWGDFASRGADRTGNRDVSPPRFQKRP